MWICPNCKRPFKHINQWHSCVQVTTNDILGDKGKNANLIYTKLRKAAKEFGPFEITCARKAIFFKHSSSFLAIKPKKGAVDIEFLLSEEINEFPIHKTFRISKNRVAHSIKLDAPEQVDRQLIGWLKRAYDLVTSS